MSLLKLRPNELETVLRLKGVHKTLAMLCDHLDFSLTLTNDILYKLVQVRNHKFKLALYHKLPTPISDYLNRVIQDNKAEPNLRILTNSNSPEWVSLVIGESKHFKSCLSFGLLGTMGQKERKALGWVSNDKDVLSVYQALLLTSDKELHGFTKSHLASFKESVNYKAGCCRYYLVDELEAFKNDDVRYVVMGSAYDFMNPESAGYQGRVRLIRYGDYWVMDTIYGNLGTSRTRVMNWLVEEEGYGLLVERKQMIGVDYGDRNNEEIYMDSSVYPNTLYKCEPVDYTGTIISNALWLFWLFDNERLVTQLVKSNRNETPRYHLGVGFYNEASQHVCSLRFLHLLNKLVPGAVIIDYPRREFHLKSIGDYRFKAVRNNSISVTKYEGEQKRNITIEYNKALLAYDGPQVEGLSRSVRYIDLLRYSRYNTTYFRSFTKLAKRYIDRI